MLSPSSIRQLEDFRFLVFPALLSAAYVARFNERIEELFRIEGDSKLIKKTTDLLTKLPEDKRADFFRRITIFDSHERIQDIPKLIMNERFRPIREQFRVPV